MVIRCCEENIMKSQSLHHHTRWYQNFVVENFVHATVFVDPMSTAKVSEILVTFETPLFLTRLQSVASDL